MDYTVVMSPSEKAIIREAMLDAQSRWLSATENTDSSLPEQVIAKVIADAFKREAERYKQTREMRTNDWLEQQRTDEHPQVSTTPALD